MDPSRIMRSRIGVPLLLLLLANLAIGVAQSPSCTGSPSGSTTPSPTQTSTFPSQLPTATQSPTQDSSPSQTATRSGMRTPTRTQTPSITATSSYSPSSLSTRTQTLSGSGSGSPSGSATPSASPSLALSVSTSSSQSASSSQNETPSASATRTRSRTRSPSLTRSSSLTVTASATPSVTATRTRSAISPTPTPSQSQPSTRTQTSSPSQTPAAAPAAATSALGIDFSSPPVIGGIVAIAVVLICLVCALVWWLWWRRRRRRELQRLAGGKPLPPAASSSTTVFVSPLHPHTGGHLPQSSSSSISTRVAGGRAAAVLPVRASAGGAPPLPLRGGQSRVAGVSAIPLSSVTTSRTAGRPAATASVSGMPRPSSRVAGGRVPGLALRVRTAGSMSSILPPPPAASNVQSMGASNEVAGEAAPPQTPRVAGKGAPSESPEQPRSPRVAGLGVTPVSLWIDSPLHVASNAGRGAALDSGSSAESSAGPPALPPTMREGRLAGSARVAEFATAPVNAASPSVSTRGFVPYVNVGLDEIAAADARSSRALLPDAGPSVKASSSGGVRSTAWSGKPLRRIAIPLDAPHPPESAAFVAPGRASAVTEAWPERSAETVPLAPAAGGQAVADSERVVSRDRSARPVRRNVVSIQPRPNQQLVPSRAELELAVGVGPPHAAEEAAESSAHDQQSHMSSAFAASISHDTAAAAAAAATAAASAATAAASARALRTLGSEALPSVEVPPMQGRGSGAVGGSAFEPPPGSTLALRPSQARRPGRAGAAAWPASPAAAANAWRGSLYGGASAPSASILAESASAAAAAAVAAATAATAAAAAATAAARAEQGLRPVWELERRQPFATVSSLDDRRDDDVAVERRSTADASMSGVGGGGPHPRPVRVVARRRGR